MLRLENISIGYGRISVVKDISLEVRSSQLVALIGPNGAGKSTVARTVSGDLRPSEGKIAFNERPIAGLEPWRIARLGIAYVPEGRGIFEALSVSENLRLGATCGHSARRRPDISAAYDMFPALFEKRNNRGGALSGGEQQMLAIGRALVSEPRMLILDEPSIGLAPHYVDIVFGAVAALVTSDMSVLLIEQKATAVLKMCDYAYLLRRGQLAFHGVPSATEWSDLLESNYLGGRESAARSGKPQSREDNHEHEQRHG